MEKFWRWLAWRLPYRLRYWVTIRAFADATTGEYAHVFASEVTQAQVLQRMT